MTFYVATHTGFLCEDGHGYYTTVDLREATPYRSFNKAEKAFRDAFKLDDQVFSGQEYYAILMPTVELQGRKWQDVEQRTVNSPGKPIRRRP